MLAAATLAFIACSKEVEINQPKEEVTHVATISLGKTDVATKTEVVEGETSASYKWLDEDTQYLHVYENGTEGTITNFSLNADKTIATLTVEFTGNPTAPYSYTAKYANTLSGSKNPLILNEQNPGTTSFDPAADVLVSKATDDVTNLTERASEFTFTMGRVVTVNKMTLTGLEEGEIISSVEFTLDKHMAGYVSYSSDENMYSYTNGGTKLTLNYTASNGVVPANGQFPVYFVSAPVESAGIVSVVVTTDKNVYTKSSSLDPNPFDGKTITFAVGTMTRFTMAMSGYSEEISAGINYTLVESQSDLFPGATYIIVGNADDLVAMGTQNDNNRASVSVTASEKVISIDNTIAASTFTIESVTKGYTILDNSTSKYLYTGSTSANRLQSTASVTDNATWTISISNGVASITNVGNTSRGVMCLNGDLFNCYASLGSYKTLSLYVDLDTCIPTLATPSVHAEVMNTNEIYVSWDEVANADSYLVTLSCTGQPNKNIATSYEYATFTSLAEGTYTVTVTAKSNDHTSYLDSQAATVENLVIGSPKGSSANPYTVAEALAAAGELATGGQSDDEVYISGIVSTVSSYNSTYKSITYYISDDGTTTGQFEVYSGKGLDGADFSAITDLAVGDEVTVKGYLKNFSGTLEVYQNSKIVDITYATRYSITVNSATNGTITASAASAGAQGLITLTATPNSGYELDEWIVKDASDNDVTVTNNQFTMPASNVTVSASFKEGNQVTLQYTAGQTTNMTGKNDAATLGLSADAWSVVGAKGSSSNYPGLNKSNYIALYYNADGSNTLTVSSLTGATISSITVSYVTNYSNGKVLVNGSEVTGNNGTYAINSSSFVITNGNTSNTQVRINSIVINY